MKKISALFVAALPNGASPLGLDRERREIGEQTAQGVGRSAGAGQEYHQIVFSDEWAISASGLMHALVSTEPALLHFSGHGDREHGLVAQNDQDKTQLLSGKWLAMTLKNFQMVRIVVLNACELAMQAQDLFEGTGVEVVVAATRPLKDRTAVLFAGNFYSFLARRLSVAKAFALANQAAVAEVPSDAENLVLIVRDGLDANAIVLDRPTIDEVTGPKKVFVLEAGREWGAKIEAALHPLVRSGSITVWHPEKMEAGLDRQKTTEKQFAEAHLVIVVADSDAFASEDFYKRLEAVMKRPAEQILTVQVGCCLIDDTILANIEMVDLVELTEKKAATVIAQRVSKRVKQLAAGSATK